MRFSPDVKTNADKQMSPTTCKSLEEDWMRNILQQNSKKENMYISLFTNLSFDKDGGLRCFFVAWRRQDGVYRSLYEHPVSFNGAVPQACQNPGIHALPQEYFATSGWQEDTHPITWNLERELCRCACKMQRDI